MDYSDKNLSKSEILEEFIKDNKEIDINDSKFKKIKYYRDLCNNDIYIIKNDNYNKIGKAESKYNSDNLQYLKINFD